MLLHLQAAIAINPREVPDAELMGTLWTLESIEVPGEIAILPERTKTFCIQFFEDNRIEGQIDCNSYGGAYTLTAGDSIQFDHLWITEMGCGESSNSIAEQNQAGLLTVHSYRIYGDQLRLYFEDSVIKFRNVE